MKLRLRTYASLFDASTVSCLVIQAYQDQQGAPRDFVIRYANGAAAARLHTTGDELQGFRYRAAPRRDNGSWLRQVCQVAFGEEERLHLLSAGEPGGYQVYAYRAAVGICVCLLFDQEQPKAVRDQDDRQLALYRTIHNCGVFSARLDEKMTLLYGNDKFYQLIGYTPEELTERYANCCRGYVHPKDQPLLRAAAEQAIAQGAHYECWGVRLVTGSGSIRYAWITGEMERQGEDWILNGVLLDITEQQRLNRLYAQRAATADLDPVTGLLTRTATLERMERYLRGEGLGGSHALILLEPEHFKTLRERQEYKKSDDLAGLISAGIKRVFRPADIIGRTGEDEFLVLMKNAPNAQVLVERVEELQESLQLICTVGESVQLLGAAVGALRFEADGRSTEELYSRLLHGLEKARAEGKTSCSLSDDALTDPIDHTGVGNPGAVQLRALMEHMNAGVLLLELGREPRVLHVSPSFYQITGRKEDEEKRRNLRLWDYVLAEDREELLVRMRRYAAERKLLDHVCRVTNLDGSVGWRNLRIVRVPYEASKYPVVIAVVTDITQQMLLEQELTALRRPGSGRLTREQNRQTVLLVGEEKQRRLLAPLLEQAYHVLTAQSTDTALEQLKLHPSAVDAVLVGELAPAERHAFLRSKASLPACNDLPVVAVVSPWDEGDTTAALQSGAWEVTSCRKELLCLRLENAIARSREGHSRRLQYLAEYDELTGLHNKNRFYAATREMLLAHPQQTFAFLRIDVNRFHLVNSYFGAEEGDRLLCHVADKLRRHVLRFAAATCGRIMADVFGCCVPYEGEQRLTEMVRLVKKAFQDYPLNFEILTCVGVYVVEDIRLPVDQIYDRATLAAKREKLDYRQGYTLYSETMRQTLEWEQEIIGGVSEALEQRQFVVYLQPLVELSTGRVISAEALVRWQHPEKGLISPREFIPVFERCGLIERLDAYMWEESCRLLRSWLDAGWDTVPISVNVSRINLYQPRLVGTLVDMTRRWRIPRELLHLELTESAYTDNPAAVRKITQALRQEGFVLLMDDFGSGWSSLHMLQDILVDILKIDMNFLGGIELSDRSRRIVTAVLRMAQSLSLPTVMEGVERADQVAFLKELGCEYAQGYHFARPMPAPAFEERFYQSESGLWLG